ncbi:MAG: penicillin-binding transpeptidase domain-containing protein [Ectobacillus sp.]
MRKAWGLVICCFFLVLTGCQKEPRPEEALEAYIKAWNNQQFDKMYEQLSSQSKKAITKEDFTKRYKTIYSGIEVSKLKVTPVVPEEVKEKNDTVQLGYTAKMEALAGPFSFKNSIKLVKEKQEKETAWRVQWNPSLIFPGMKEGDKVRVKTFEAKRGEIVDRNGNGLAINGAAKQVGIVPEKLGPDAEQTKEALAMLLGMAVENIESKIKAKWVQPHYFVPIAVLPDEANDDDYISLPGVAVQQIPMRTYPLKEAAAHLTGYIREVSAEDLKKLKGYKPGDVVGKAGMEQVYENELRGEDGGRIYIVDANGNEKKELAKRQAKDGQTLVAAIDANLQQDIYKEMNGDAGTSAAVNPKTGEVLALISSPAYDPNAFVRGIKPSQWEAWSNDPKKPMLNRFTKAYAPGSVFKPITAAIGLNTKTLNPNEAKEISGLKWAQNSSWGNYYVTRVKEVSPVNLEKAMLYSDNIYFAQQGLEIGKERFVEEAKKFGFGEKLPLSYPFQQSSLAANGVKTNIQLADTAYGQGEVVMTSLHMALAYAPIAADGNIPAPSLKKGENEGKVWKEGVMTSEQAKLLENTLIQVVNHPEGTGRAAKMEGAILAGKTGTAELKKEKGGQGQENGWFVAYNTNAPDTVIAMMIEDVKERGGSSYVAGKVKNVFSRR